MSIFCVKVRVIILANGTVGQGEHDELENDNDIASTLVPTRTSAPSKTTLNMRRWVGMSPPSLKSTTD